MITPAQVFVLQHNWEANVVRKLTWKTDVILMRNGAEQRRRLRSTPQEQLTYTITMTSQEESARLARLLWSTKDLRIAFPRWEDAMMLQVALAPGDVAVVLDATIAPRQFITDAVLYHEQYGVERITIDTVVGDTLNLDPLLPIVSAWPAGVMVIPLITGYVAPQLSGDDSGHLQASLTLSIDLEEDVAGVTDGGDVVAMVPATIDVYPHAPGSEGIIAFGDVQGIVIEVKDAAGALIPDADVTVDPPPGPGFVDVYPTGMPNIWNVRNLRADTSLGATPQTVTLIVTAGAVTTNYDVVIE